MLGVGSWDLLKQMLTQHRRTVHSWLAKGSISQQLRVNLKGVLRLLPLFEHLTYRFDNNQ